MNKSIKKSLYICAAALMIGGVAAPTVSNSISASAHSRTAISRYSHKKNVRKNDVKRLRHLQNVHKYHLRLEKKTKRNLAKHEKSLARYNHLIHVHKHNRKMINNLTRAKNKLIKMIKADQHGITRQASLVESEEHKISLIKHGKKVTPSNIKKGRHGHKGNYDGKGYSYWFNLGKHGRHNSKRNMNHWENRAYYAGYNSIHNHKSEPTSNSAQSQANAKRWFNLGESTMRSAVNSHYASEFAPAAYNRGAYMSGMIKGFYDKTKGTSMGDLVASENPWLTSGAANSAKPASGLVSLKASSDDDGGLWPLEHHPVLPWFATHSIASASVVNSASANNANAANMNTANYSNNANTK